MAVSDSSCSPADDNKDDEDFFLSLSVRRGKRIEIHMEITDKIVSKTITQPADLENRFCLIKRDNSISHILADCIIRAAG